VIKVNRGSMGEGVWLVGPHGWERREGHVPGPEALVEVTEMVDNKRSVLALGDFMEHAARIGFEGAPRGACSETAWRAGGGGEAVVVPRAQGAWL
jgi:hypothetical protein